MPRSWPGSTSASATTPPTSRRGWPAPSPDRRFKGATGQTVAMATALRNSNPALDEKAFQRVAETEPGWAAGTQTLEDAYAAPSAVVHTDGMTVGGTVWATAALLVLVVASGTYGWSSV